MCNRFSGQSSLLAAIAGDKLCLCGRTCGEEACFSGRGGPAIKSSCSSSTVCGRPAVEISDLTRLLVALRVPSDLLDDEWESLLACSEEQEAVLARVSRGEGVLGIAVANVGVDCSLYSTAASREALLSKFAAGGSHWHESASLCSAHLGNALQWFDGVEGAPFVCFADSLERARTPARLSRIWRSIPCGFLGAWLSLSEGPVTINSTNIVFKQLASGRFTRILRALPERAGKINRIFEDWLCIRVLCKCSAKASHRDFFCIQRRAERWLERPSLLVRSAARSRAPCGAL